MSFWKCSTLVGNTKKLMDFRNQKPSFNTLLLSRSKLPISSPTRIHKNILYVPASYSRHKRNLRGTTTTATTKRHSTSSPRIRCANFSPDAAYVCTGAFDGVAKVSWPPGKGVVFCRFCIAAVGRFCVPGSLEHPLPCGFQFFRCFVRCENSPKWALSG